MPDHVSNYVETDVPAGVTLAQWRRTRLAPTPRRRLGWLRTLDNVRSGRRIEPSNRAFGSATGSSST